MVRRRVMFSWPAVFIYNWLGGRCSRLAVRPFPDPWSPNYARYHRRPARYRGAIPFIPFVLHLKSEELVRVGAPEHIAYAEGGSQCTVYEGRDFRFIQLSDVVAIDQVLETQPVRRKRLSVAAYEQTAADGILPETSRLELIEGRIVEKDWMSPPSACAGEKCREVLDRVVPRGWYVRECGPVRIPSRDSEPEPEVSVVRGQPGHTGSAIPALRTSPWSSRSSGGTSPRNAGWPRRMAAAAFRSTGSSTSPIASSRFMVPRSPARTQPPRSWERRSRSRSSSTARSSAPSPWPACCRARGRRRRHDVPSPRRPALAPVVPLVPLHRAWKAVIELIMVSP